MMGRPEVWIVDDDLSVLRALRRLIESLSCSCMIFDSGTEFLARIGEPFPDLIILDIQMPELAGLGVLDEIGRRGIPVATVMMTGVERDGLDEACLAGGAVELLRKPIGVAELTRLLAALGIARPGPAT